MAEQGYNREAQLKALRRGLVIVGVIIILVALLADLVGLSAAGTFGSGQLLGVVIGFLIVLAGLFWQKLFNAYQMTAVILLNTLLVFGLLEFTLAGDQALFAWNIGAQPAATNQSTSESEDAAFKRELVESDPMRYEPYVIWRRATYDGEFVNVDERGIRETPGADCTEDAYNIFFFGGSTAWGFGVKDWETIAAYLQQQFETIREPICVTNLGEGAQVSTQNLLTLLLQLQKGERPDLVIFYNGVNEVLAPYHQGRVDAHWDMILIANSFENGTVLANPQGVRVNPLQYTNTYQFIRSLIPSSTPQVGEITDQEAALDELVTEFSQGIVDLYLANYKLAQALADDYGFEVYFFWQPVIFAENKPRTENEVEFAKFEGETFESLYIQTYDYARSVVDDYEDFYYIADAFDGITDELYLDFMHTNPQGNEVVANAIFNIISTTSSLEPIHTEE